MAERYIYKHVVIVGLDGMGVFNKEASTPEMDRIFENGAKTYDALSLYPTISAQNWGGMLLGTEPEVHGLTNGIVGREHYTNKAIPSIFTTVRQAMPDAVLCSISDWNPINYGIIEQDVGVYMDTGSCGEVVTDKVVDCVLTQKPTLLFIQIDDPDGAGHHFGYGTPEQRECISKVDTMVGRIHKAYEDAGILEDTLFITITDHGGFIHGHGGYTVGEKYIYFALSGKTVKKTEGFFAQTKDINAVVRYAFGIDIPGYDIEGYSSQVPENVFADFDCAYERSKAARFDVENLPTPAIDGEGGLYSFFDRDRVKLAMFFDNNLEDATGKNTFEECGHVKFYSTGCRGAMAEMGSIGYLVNDDFKVGKDSFTVGVWLKVDDAPGRDCFYCGTKTMSESGAGFMLGFNVAGTMLGIETEDKSSYHEITTPYLREISGGWIHALYSFNKEKLTVDIYHNFVLKRTVQLPDIFDISLDALPFTIGEDASHVENKSANIIFNLDDLFIFNGAFDENDVEKLKKYYSL